MIAQISSEIDTPMIPSKLAWLAAPSNGFLFIITYPRSGDLLLQQILNTIDGYCIRGESNDSIAQISIAFRRIENAEMGSARSPDRSLIELGWSFADAFAKNVLSPPQTTRVVGFRESSISSDPEQFWAMMDFMYSFFPNARFVFNTRDPKRVIHLGKWARMPDDEALKEIAKVEALFDSFARARPLSSYQLCYDDYVEKPENLASLYDFLGEELYLDKIIQLIRDAR